MFTVPSAVIFLMIYGVDSVTIKQNQKIWIKPIGKTVFFKCEVTGLGASNYVHWYHKKDGGTFKRLLYISESGSPTIEAKEFAAEKNGNSYDIKLSVIKKEHAGVYYCAYWDGSHDECMNQQITYPDRQIIRQRGRTALIRCNVDTSYAIHLYRAKSGGALERIMYFDSGSKTPKKEAGFDGFRGSKGANQVTLSFPAALEDAGMYYCALWSSDNHSVNRERKS
ncbi:T-cell receptor gamma [Triplophysa rosa]|nr:T-cell receptor gamma [Triplophysa rosa]